MAADSIEEMKVFKIPHVEGFTATNVLTRQECAELIRAAEASGFKGSGKDGGPYFAGNRLRTTIPNATSWSERLFTRLQPFLSPVHHQSQSFNYDLLGPPVPSGKYVPVAVNDLLRVSKYVPYGQFGIHEDSGYVRDDQYVGFWTLLLYLNDDFEGGETTIYGANDDLAYTVQPEVGKAFAFYHFQPHAGLMIKSGSKLVVRTEIMFALEKKGEN